MSVLGLGSIALPYAGLQFRAMRGLADLQPVAGLIVAGVGVFLVVMSYRRGD